MLEENLRIFFKIMVFERVFLDLKCLIIPRPPLPVLSSQRDQMIAEYIII
jgi:hypothetical protein